MGTGGLALWSRVAVVGSSGSGKTTFARGLAEALNISHVELDSIFHQAEWTPINVEEFEARVGEVVRGERWVIDGNYASVRDLVWSRAKVVVWLDLPLWRVMQQLVRRTVRRGLARQELWNGNRESWRNLVRRDPDLNILLSAWRTHSRLRVELPLAAEAPRNSQLRLVRLRSHHEADTFLAAIEAEAVPPEFDWAARGCRG